MCLLAVAVAAGAVAVDRNCKGTAVTAAVAGAVAVKVAID